MSKGFDKLKSGDFNSMNCETLADGSVIITLTKKGDKGKYYKFKVEKMDKIHNLKETEIINDGD